MEDGGSRLKNFGKLGSSNGSIEVSGNQGVNLNNGTNLTAKENVDVTSPNGSVNVTGTNITSTDGKVNITAKENTTIENSNISGN
ncbi:hypothetical protein [Psittacicella hinzii]|uniref:Uncharacterized protein n=2 Tax=Psittacicella hinzii TaxID=2028575 RepID=A0A3A1YEF0_9GAMM|nr:hypothetical protein CKF58_06235 [Psittacicella hinzii]